MKRITVDLVMSYNPCQPEYSRESVEELFAGRKFIYPKTVLKMNIPAEDKFWLLLRDDFLSEKDQRLFACDCAERVLHLYEKEYDNSAPRKAIETARLYANGEATQEELRAASSAAYSAAYSAASRAAYSAASSAAYSAASRAAYNAASSAAFSAASSAASRAASRAAFSAAFRAEEQWQLERLEYYLRLNK